MAQYQDLSKCFCLASEQTVFNTFTTTESELRTCPQQFTISYPNCIEVKLNNNRNNCKH